MEEKTRITYSTTVVQDAAGMGRFQLGGGGYADRIFRLGNAGTPQDDIGLRPGTAPAFRNPRPRSHVRWSRDAACPRQHYTPTDWCLSDIVGLALMITLIIRSCHSVLTCCLSDPRPGGTP